MGETRIIHGLILLFYSTFFCCHAQIQSQQQYCLGSSTVFYQSGNPLTCTPTSSYYSSNYGSSYYGTTSSRGCPSGYTCQSLSLYSSSSSASGQSYCCSTGTASNNIPTFGSTQLSPFCPPNSQLWTDKGGSGNALSCSVQGAFCQNGYTCQQGTYSTQLYCCSTGSLFGTGIQLCPYGAKPLYQGTSAQTCSTSGYSSCPYGYTCVPQGYGSAGYSASGYGSTGYCCTNRIRAKRQYSYGTTGYGSNYGTSDYGTGYGMNYGTGYGTNYGTGYGTSNYGTGYGTSNYGTGYGTNYGTGYGTSNYGTGYGTNSGIGYGANYGTGYGNNYGTGYGTSNYGTGYGTNYGTGYGTSGYGVGYGAGTYGGAGYYGGTGGYGYGSSAYGQSCPYGSTPYNYMGTSIPLGCTVGVTQCPGTSICQCSSSSCISGTPGACCTSGYSYGYGGNTGGYGIGGNQQSEQTGDPYCSTAIVGVTCSAGSTMCSQYGSQYVCQYNNARQQYLCCISASSYYQGRKKRSPKNRAITA